MEKKTFKTIKKKFFYKIIFFRNDRPTLHVIGDRLFVVGGNDASLDVDILSIDDGEWSVVKNALKTPRMHHAATLVDAKYFPECDI